MSMAKESAGVVGARVEEASEAISFQVCNFRASSRRPHINNTKAKRIPRHNEKTFMELLAYQRNSRRTFRSKNRNKTKQISSAEKL